MKIILILLFSYFVVYVHSIQCSNSQNMFGFGEYDASSGFTYATGTSTSNRGIKFKSSKDGLIVGLKFYVRSGEALMGPFTGGIYSSSSPNTLESTTVSFPSVTKLGWQVKEFTEPFFITAGTSYLVLINPQG